MKTITLITLALLLTISVKAQSRVDNGQYTSEVSFNWADSVKKYDEICDYYRWYSATLYPISVNKLDSIYFNYSNIRKIYKAKIDSLSAIQENKKRLKRKSELEKKYHIKLP